MIKNAIGWIVFATGVLILAGSVWYAYEATRFLAGTEPATGEIIEHEFSHGLSTGSREVGSSSRTQVIDMYAPIVAFRTSSVTNIRFRANWSEGDPPAVGSSVPVRYPAQFPENARISGIASLYGGAGILFVLGMIFAGAGGLIVVRQGMMDRSGR